MKTYKGLYDKCIDKDFIRRCIFEAAKNKRSRKDVARTLADVDRYVEIIYNMLLTESYEPRLPRETVIKEGTRNKQRVIRKIRFFDQIIHHIVIDACKEVFTHGMYVYCCGSVPERGIHYAKRYIERWVRTDCKNTKYCVQMDIRHYFDSVDHDVLKACLHKRIKDARMLRLLDKIIDSGGQGIPLGYYTSQWFANFLLEELDHMIKEKLHVKYYVRYLDDMVIFGRNKKELHKARAAIAEYLQVQLKLCMKGNYQLFRMVYTDKNGQERGRALDFLGFRFYRDKTILRKSLMYRTTRTAARIGKKNRPTRYDAARMLSYMGWVSHSNTYAMYEARIKQKIDVKQLKKIISSDSKRKEREKRVKNQLADSDGNTDSKARHGGHTEQSDAGISAKEYQEDNKRAARRRREDVGV